MRPDDIPEDVWRDVELRIMPRDLVGSPLGDLVHRNCCYGILAERAKTEARALDLLKDPAAVRVNYLRGNIACQPLIDEAVAAERERCLGIIEKQKQAFLSPEYAFPQPMGSFSECYACDQIAAAITGSTSR